jgi:hypothetical protein
MIFGPESDGVYICNKFYNIGGPIGFEERKCYTIGFIENHDGTKDMWSDGVWYVSIEEYKVSHGVLIRYWWQILPRLIMEGYISKLSEKELIIKDIIE